MYSVQKPKVLFDPFKQELCSPFDLLFEPDTGEHLLLLGSAVMSHNHTGVVHTEGLFTSVCITEK